MSEITTTLQFRTTALEAVRQLNNMWLDNAPPELHSQPIPFDYTTNTATQESVTFFGMPVWDSQNDERGYVNEGTDQEEHEPLLPWLARRAMEIANEMQAHAAVTLAAVHMQPEATPTGS